MQGVGNRPGWAWIFILEGLFTVLFGITSYFILPRSPSHTRFFSEEEKAYVIAKLEEDGTRNDAADMFSWREVGKAFTLPQVWILAIVLFLDGNYDFTYVRRISDRYLQALWSMRWHSKSRT